MEVMGLMLGEFVDDYTVRVIDVFAMPQTGTVNVKIQARRLMKCIYTITFVFFWFSQGVSVEAVDPVFQAKMLDMLKQTGRPEMVVGWYHSHPGFGCWLSGVDINTQQSFEALSERAVAVVIDPIQSVKGKVVIDAFRLINPNMMVSISVGIVPADCDLIVSIAGFGTRTETNDVEFRPPTETIRSSVDTRIESALLQY